MIKQMKHQILGLFIENQTLLHKFKMKNGQIKKKDFIFLFLLLSNMLCKFSSKKTFLNFIVQNMI